MINFGDFLIFLYKKGVLSAYFDAMAFYASEHSVHSMKKLLKNVMKANPYSYVTNSFLWWKTKEGKDFWYNISLSWNSFINNER